MLRPEGEEERGAAREGLEVPAVPGGQQRAKLLEELPLAAGPLEEGPRLRGVGVGGDLGVGRRRIAPCAGLSAQTTASPRRWKAFGGACARWRRTPARRPGTSPPSTPRRGPRAPRLRRPARARTRPTPTGRSSPARRRARAGRVAGDRGGPRRRGCRRRALRRAACCASGRRARCRAPAGRCARAPR